MMILLLIVMMMMVLLVAMVCLAHFWVQRFSRPYLKESFQDLPEVETALVLGTVPKLLNGEPNLYFQYRIQAAADLYQHTKVQHIIVSGDENSRQYNEPDEMQAALVSHGVPINQITTDYAGFRTLDSILRARDVFGQNRLIIVSQPFHNERAVYLARAHGIEAYAYNARKVAPNNRSKTRLREYGARVKMFWDLWTNQSARQPD